MSKPMQTNVLVKKRKGLSTLKKGFTWQAPHPPKKKKKKKKKKKTFEV